MTKARIAIFIASFLAFALIGFAIAYLIRFRMPSPVANPTIQTHIPTTSQQNLLIIHVDELSKPSPTLISVWVVFFAQYDQAFVSFKSLHPDPLSPRPLIPVTVLFSLNEEGKPSDVFLKWVSDHQLEWIAYVVIDQKGLAQIAEQVDSPRLDFIIPRSKDQLQAVWQQEARLMDHLCMQLQPGNNKTELNWNELIPDHFHSDLSFEEAILIWSQLQTGSASPNCEVFGRNQSSN
jgi:hypothetical protein